jgi:hypothetical protein
LGFITVWLLSPRRSVFWCFSYLFGLIYATLVIQPNGWYRTNEGQEMTNTAKVTKALRSAGYQVTTDMTNTLKVKKTRFKEETHVTVKWTMPSRWTQTVDWRIEHQKVTAKLVELGFDAVLTENNFIEVSFADKVGA